MLKSCSNCSKLAMMGSQLFSGLFQMFSDIIKIVLMFSDVFRCSKDALNYSQMFLTFSNVFKIWSDVLRYFQVFLDVIQMFSRCRLDILQVF